MSSTPPTASMSPDGEKDRLRNVGENASATAKYEPEGGKAHE